MKKYSIWLRAETKKNEKRTPLTPSHAGRLVSKGFEVFVEKSADRIFSDVEYSSRGCKLVETASWKTLSTGNTYILGLKELPAEDTSPLSQKHIYFAHAFKNQTGSEIVLKRFLDGGGKLFDLEFLVTPDGRRVAAFGYWAGFVGAALAVAAWCKQKQDSSKHLAALTPFSSKTELLEMLASNLRSTEHTLPRALVVGARGRCGQGAVECFLSLGIDVTGWDVEETKKGGPFKEILDYSLFVNCVLLLNKIPPFLTKELIESVESRQLSVISDVSCDPNSLNNPVPLYSVCTTLEKPTLRFSENPALDLITIDHLPTLLPRESSEDFSLQLLPHLETLLEKQDSFEAYPWQHAEKVFNSKIETLRSSNHEAANAI